MVTSSVQWECLAHTVSLNSQQRHTPTLAGRTRWNCVPTGRSGTYDTYRDRREHSAHCYSDRADALGAATAKELTVSVKEGRHSRAAQLSLLSLASNRWRPNADSDCRPALLAVRFPTTALTSLCPERRAATVHQELARTQSITACMEMLLLARRLL